MRIESVTIEDAFSADRVPVTIGPLSDLSLLIGKNNAGKSNFIRAVEWLALSVENVSGPGVQVALPDGFGHQSDDEHRRIISKISLRVVLNDEERQQCAGGFDVPDAPRQALLTDALAKPISIGFQSIATKPDTGHVNIALDNQEQLASDWVNAPNCPQLNPKEWNPKIAAPLHKYVGKAFASSIRYVSGWRTLENTTGPKNVRPGYNVMEDLFQWSSSNQAATARDLYRQFTKTVKLFASIMGWSEVSIKAQQKAVMVVHNDRHLSINSLGDGVQHVLMLAHAIIVSPTAILLLEEPETHLHPEVQRRVMAAIKDKFRGQAIITTHSPTFLDGSFAQSITRIEQANGISSVCSCASLTDLHDVLNQLDVRASDLLQANVVIWVEGPSDRIFLKRCLEVFGSSWSEGKHFQFAYYGGAVRKHFAIGTGNDTLIDILRLSRHVVMICDSDKNEESDPIDSEKMRLKSECEASGGLYIVTKGREVENYLSDRVLTSAYRAMLAEPGIEIKLKQWERLKEALSRAVPNPKHGQKQHLDYSENKVEYMARIVQHLEKQDLEWLGLRQVLQSIEQRIGWGNGRKKDAVGGTSVEYALTHG